MIVHSLEKCGISVAPDGSEDEKINIIGLEYYSVDSDDTTVWMVMMMKSHFQMKRGEEDEGVE